MKILCKSIALSFIACSVLFAQEVQMHVYYLAQKSSKEAQRSEFHWSIENKEYPLIIELKECCAPASHKEKLKKLEDVLGLECQKQWHWTVEDLGRKKCFSLVKAKHFCAPLSSCALIGSMEIISYADSKVKASFELHDDIYDISLNQMFILNKWMIFDRQDCTLLMYFDSQGR